MSFWSDIKTLNFEDLIKNLNLQVFDDVIWNGMWLWKIAELTYSYDKSTNINETLFIKIWWLDLVQFKNSSNKEELLIKAHDYLKNILDWKIDDIHYAINEVHKKIDKDLQEEEIILKNIFINALSEKKQLLEYCIITLPYELEKWWIELQLSNDQIKELDKNIISIENDIYWGQVHKNPEEVRLSYEYIYELFLENQHKLSDDDIKIFKLYIWKIEPYLPENYIFSSKVKLDKLEDTFLDIAIPRADYILAFNMLVDTFGKMQHVVKSDMFVWSISDAPDGIYFPWHERFDTITIERFFTLWMHEIETHTLTDYNTKELLGNLRGSWSTEKDEGLAIFMEQIFLYGNKLISINSEWKPYFDKEKLQLKGYYIKILMWELLDNTQLMDFLHLLDKLNPANISLLESYKRLKRNNKAGVQHKDTTYTRGLYILIDEINKYILSDWKEWICVQDLFVWKISFTETQDLVRMKQIKETKNNSLMPLFISDAVYYVIKNKLKGSDNNINKEKFQAYLIEKYPLFEFIHNIDYELYFWKDSRVIAISNIFLQVISKSHVQKLLSESENSDSKVLEKLIDSQYRDKIEKIHKDMPSHRQNRQ